MRDQYFCWMKFPTKSNRSGDAEQNWSTNFYIRFNIQGVPKHSVIIEGVNSLAHIMTQSSYKYVS